jgi:MOSC domain-containing protein YiiM
LNIVSTNIAQPTTLIWNGKAITTGIYKNPVVNYPIYLEKESVRGDEVSDRSVHGGIYKACYLFSAENYPYWKVLYPNLKWDYGMFGENLTVSGLDESKILVGDIYKIGEALVQVTQPREPCYKFGVKFGNQGVLKQFIEHAHPGLYVRILDEGFVRVNDEMTLVEQAKNSLTIQDFYKLVFAKHKNQEHLKLAVNNDALPLRKREKLRNYIIG